MSNNSLDSARQAVLGTQPRSIVPLVAVFDGSDFGRAAQREFEILKPAAFRKVLRNGRSDEVSEVLGGIIEAGFQASIRPLALIPHQPIWCCWFQELGKGFLDDWKDREKQLRDGLPTSLRWLLFLKVPDGTLAKDIGDQLADMGEPLPLVFLLGEQGQLTRSPQQLALGSVALMLAGWETFCFTGELDVAKALLLRGTSGDTGTAVRVLGIGSNGIDVAYHQARWSRNAANSLVRCWSEPAAEVDTPPGRSPGEAVRSLLPKRGYHIEKPTDDDPLRPGLIVGRTQFNVRWGGDDGFQPLRGLSNKDNMRHFLSLVRDTKTFLKAIVLPNTERFARRRALEQIEETMGELSKCAALPKDPRGLFDLMKKRLHALHASYKGLATARSSGRERMTPFATCFAAARQRIEALPDPRGALLRIGLVTVGLAWLFVGPVVFGSGPLELSRNPDLAVLLGSPILFALLVGGAALSYLWRNRRAIRGLEAARESMIDEHVGKVCVHLADKLGEVGSSACKAVEEKEAELAALQDSLRTRLTDGAGGLVQLPPNRRPYFGDDVVDRLLRERTAELVTPIYETWKADMESTCIEFDAERWQSALEHAATACTGDVLENIDFADLAEATALTEQARQEILADAVSDARKPSIRMRGADDACVLCLAPASWTKDLAGLINVETHDLPCRELLAVSVQPVISEVAV